MRSRPQKQIEQDIEAEEDVACKADNQHERKAGQNDTGKKKHGHIAYSIAKKKTTSQKGDRVLVRAEGLEPPTLWFEAKCSIQLSYARISTERGNGTRFLDQGQKIVHHCDVRIGSSAVEQVTLNHLVVGSNPARCTRKIPRQKTRYFSFPKFAITTPSLSVHLQRPQSALPAYLSPRPSQ